MATSGPSTSSVGQMIPFSHSHISLNKTEHRNSRDISSFNSSIKCTSEALKI